MSSDEQEWLPGEKEELMGSRPELLTMEQHHKNWAYPTELQL